MIKKIFSIPLLLNTGNIRVFWYLEYIMVPMHTRTFHTDAHGSRICNNGLSNITGRLRDLYDMITYRYGWFPVE